MESRQITEEVEENTEQMAEAAVETQRNARFFCHQCSREISPNLSDFTCPTCLGGFIEELSEETSVDEEDRPAQEHEDPALQFANQLWEQTFLDLPRARGKSEQYIYLLERRRRERGGRHVVTDHGGRPPMISIRTTRQGDSFPNTTADAATAAALDVILRNLFGPMHNTEESTGGTHFGFPLNLLHLHGSPGDYAWGSGGLDAIITQLLNQMEGTGPPPADKKKIDTLPKLRISQDLVDSHAECAVCQETYSLDEEVVQLPCEHRFHRDCIVPWLEKHDSCPICRLSLNSKPTRGAEDEDSSSSSSGSGQATLM